MAKKRITRAPQKKVDTKAESKNVDVTIIKDPNFSIQNVFSQITSQFSDLNSTGTIIGGTIGSLHQRVESIEQILVHPNYGEKFSLIEAELFTIKTEILPQLEQSKQTITKVEEYIKNNASFLTDLISSEERLRSLESEVLSLTKILDKMQSEKSLAWNRTTTIVSIILAIIGTAFGVYFGFLK